VTHKSIVLLNVICIGATLASSSLAQKVNSVKPFPVAVRVEGSPMSVSSSDVDKSMRVTVGHTLFLDSQRPLAQIYVDDPLVIQPYASSPTQVVISGLVPGTATVVLWDKQGNHTAYTINVDKNVEQLQQAFEYELPMDRIQATSDRDTIILTGYVTSQQEYQMASKLAASFNQKPSSSQGGSGGSTGGSTTQTIANALRIAPPHLRQVRLEVKFAEIDRTKAAQFGVNLLSMGNTIGMTGTSQFGGFSGPSTLGAGVKATTAVAAPELLLFSQSSNLGAAITALENQNIMQILAEPTITALSGHTGTFLAGGEFPYPVVSGTTGGTSVSVQFMPYGVSLNFLPVVLADGTIRLHVAPEVSALDYTNSVTIDGTVEPAISTRRAATDIELRDGQTFALSGLLDKTITDQFESIPFLSQIPILGQFFRSKSTTKTNMELLVIVTPHIIDEVSHPDPTPADVKPAVPYLTNKAFDNGVMVKKQNGN
jgi:pilus assembly protein CpaC